LHRNLLFVIDGKKKSSQGLEFEREMVQFTLGGALPMLNDKANKEPELELKLLGVV
jgi:hypothetical protein